MEQKIENLVGNYINRKKLFKPGQNVLLAVSGGADSVALVHILNNLKIAKRLNINIRIAHINHQLRGTHADNDEKFVVALAKKLNLPVNTRTVDVKNFASENKLSIETAARKLRLEALTKIAKKHNCTSIVTAHHKDDNAETIIHRLRRGTGFAGLAGIRSKIEFDSGTTFIRPLLCVTKERIENYLRKKNLNWQTDATNTDLRFTRNFIRHKLIPHLKKNCGKDLVQALFNLTETCADLDNRIKSHAGKIYKSLCIESAKDSITLSRAKFISQPQPIQFAIINKTLTTIGCGLQNFTALHYEKISSFAESAQSGKHLALPNKYKMLIDTKTITFKKPGSQNHDQPLPTNIKVPGKTKFAQYTIETKIFSVADCDIEKFKLQKDNFIEWFDADKIEQPLTAKPRQTADRFTPLGRKRPKRVGKFITNLKITQKMRKNLFVIADSENIIWLCPARISESVRVTNGTKKILQIKLLPARQ